MIKKVADLVEKNDVKSDKASRKTADNMLLWDAMFNPEKYKKDKIEATKQKRIAAAKVKKTI
jgi:hypothetical protein